MEAAVGGDHENCSQLRQRIIEEEKRQAEIGRITSRTSKIAALVNVSVLL